MDRSELTIWRIPRMEVHHFDTIAEIEATKYNIPNKRNFPAIDALCPVCCEIIQVTSNCSHGIKGNDLTQLHPIFSPHLKTGQKVKFIFIVPPHRFSDYPVQRIIDSRAKGTTKEMEVDWIEQYVVEVDVSPLTHSFDEKMGKLIKKKAKGQKSNTD